MFYLQQNDVPKALLWFHAVDGEKENQTVIGFNPTDFLFEAPDQTDTKLASLNFAKFFFC